MSRKMELLLGVIYLLEQMKSFGLKEAPKTSRGFLTLINGFPYIKKTYSSLKVFPVDRLPAKSLYKILTDLVKISGRNGVAR